MSRTADTVPPPAPQPTRAELIARIAASSKDAVVLAEMQRLGFWPADSSQPTIEAALITREAELMQTLQKLQAEWQQKGDPAAALKALHEERKAQARARREATAQRREHERHERALRWHEARRSAVLYLGAGVSGGLNEAPAATPVDHATSTRGLPGATPTGSTSSKAGQPGKARADANAPRPTRHDQLQRHGLPMIETPQALADAMGITVPELRFLCFHREVARTTHYRRFTLPKKSGGERTISAPMPRLKRAQYWVLDNLLAKVPCHAAAHGFLPGRSIVSNAAVHAGQSVVINLDLKDFFPSIRYPRIKGVFVGLGYSERIATLLALLCSENVSDELVVDGERFFVGHAARERVLPQGAPTSPMLTNILCRRLDRRLQGAAAKLGFAYTRYADDLSFSAPPDAAERTGRLLRQVHHILRDEGFTPHPAKQHVMRAGARQEVTGIVVNQQPAVARQQRRALRASLHRARTRGLAETTWQGQPATKDVLLGYAQFVAMVNARHGTTFLAQARALPSDMSGHGVAAAAASGAATAKENGAAAAASGIGRESATGNRAGTGTGSDSFRARAARGEAPLRAAGPWWQPVEAPAPVLQRTAGQVKEERLARLSDQREQRQSGTTAPGTSTAPSSRGDEAGRASARASGPGAGGLPPTPTQWLAVVLQFIFVVFLAAKTRSALVFALGTCWLGFRLMTRRFGWLGFLLPLAIAAALAVALQG